jgi:hypothetical protein
MAFTEVFTPVLANLARRTKNFKRELTHLPKLAYGVIIGTRVCTCSRFQVVSPTRKAVWYRNCMRQDQS